AGVRGGPDCRGAGWARRRGRRSGHTGYVSTMVFFYAHPDDETSQTAGMMALAARRGHRVVTVFATDGDHGQRPEHLGPDGDLVEHRRGEAEAAGRVLGTARIDWLRYRDSGMTGWAQNDDPRSLHRADTDDAAARLARILHREDADLLDGYDPHGNYVHPDHLAVHRIGTRAVELAAGRPPAPAPCRHRRRRRPPRPYPRPRGRRRPARLRPPRQLRPPRPPGRAPHRHPRRRPRRPAAATAGGPHHPRRPGPDARRPR